MSSIAFVRSFRNPAWGMQKGIPASQDHPRVWQPLDGCTKPSETGVDHGESTLDACYRTVCLYSVPPDSRNFSDARNRIRRLGKSALRAIINLNRHQTRSRESRYKILGLWQIGGFIEGIKLCVDPIVLGASNQLGSLLRTAALCNPRQVLLLDRKHLPDRGRAARSAEANH